MKATCWSITINNPVDGEENRWQNVPGWKLVGQFEVGEKNGVRHIQGMLKTPQVRFAAVKRVFPRAHIQIARNEAALTNYVKKPETRVDVYTPGEAIPTIFEYQATVAAQWKDTEWTSMIQNVLEDKIDDTAMLYLDILVKRDIEAGKRGCEWIAINPMWRSSWKKFWRSIIKREHAKNNDAQVGQEGNDIHEEGSSGTPQDSSESDDEAHQESS